MIKSRKPLIMIAGPRSNYLLRFLPRLFYGAGAEVIMAAPRGSSILSSRYINHVIDFDSSHPHAIAQLEESVATVNPDHLIIIEEPLLGKIMSAPPESLPEIRKRLGHLEAVPLVRSAFHFWAESHGISIPEGRMVGSSAELKQSVRDWGSVYLKRDHTSGGMGVCRVSHPDQADQAWSRIPVGEQVLVQRALHGRVGVTDMICKHGKLMAWVSSEKWRTAQNCGPSVARRLCEVPGMESLAFHVARETGFHGLCGFDWVIDQEDGLPRLIEFHPRPPSGYGIGKWAGVHYEEAISAVLDLTKSGSQRPQESCFRTKSVCCYFPDHPLACIRQRDWPELRRWLPGSDSRSWSMLPWDDPALLFQMLKNAFNRT